MAAQSSSKDHIVSIEGQQYTLRFSLRSWAALTDKWQLPNIPAAQNRLKTLGDDLKVEDIVDVFWAALIAHHRELTPEDAFEIADAAGIETITEIISGLLSGASPPVDNSKKKPRPPTIDRR